MSHSILLEGVSLRFAAAHMATTGGELEPLHGHNYAVTVELTGDLTPDSWVLDFSEAKALVRAVCGELDHRFILQADGGLDISERGNDLEIRFGARSYVIPRSDVVSLPIDNSTAERLAEWFAGRIAKDLKARGVTNVSRVSVGIEEMPGQSGWFTLEGPGESV